MELVRLQPHNSGMKERFFGSRERRAKREKQQRGRESSRCRLSESGLTQRGEEGRKGGRGEEELEKAIDII